MWATRLLAFAQLVTLSISAPPGFPLSGNGLWFNSSANVWAKEWLPVGNGYLAAMVPGGTAYEATQLNIESLWSGGPSSDPSYNGGNKKSGDQFSIAQVMDDIRQQIFQSRTGDISSKLRYPRSKSKRKLIRSCKGISQLTTEPGAYGSYAGAGYLISRINITGTVSNYGRYLDLDEGIARTIWTQSGITYVRTTICSHPTQACTQHITTTVPLGPSRPLPHLLYSFSSSQEIGLPAPNITCLDSSTLQIRGTTEPNGGMIYEILARLQTIPVGDQLETTQCIQYPVPPGSPANATLEVKAGTSREAWISWVGDTDYSMDAGNSKSGYSFRGSDPHNALFGLISSSTLDTSSFSSLLSQHVADYKAALTDKFSLSLGQTPRLDVPTDIIKAMYQIDVGDRYLEWLLFNYGRYMLVSSARGSLPANLQGKWANGYANAWSADYHSNINIQMNYWAAEMTNLDVTIPLFDYFEKTWAPRELLANVVNPTGCAHAQQLIWQLFNAVEKGFDTSGDTDTAFLAEVKAKRAQMDKGIHIGSWGQLQEWKVDRDSPTDTHRHLSHLIGLYPGYAVAGYDPSIQGNFTKQQVVDAATVSLIHRGNGTGPDADSGWEKAWRAAAWAQLGNATEFYHELSYAIDRNFGPSLFSLYNPSDPDPIFQIDANLAYPAALLNALIQVPDVASYSTPLTVTLLPALPKQWPSGSIKGARLRGGLTLDLRWSNGKPVSASFKADNNVVSRIVLVTYQGKTLASFKTASGLTISKYSVVDSGFVPSEVNNLVGLYASLVPVKRYVNLVWSPFYRYTDDSQMDDFEGEDFEEEEGYEIEDFEEPADGNSEDSANQDWEGSLDENLDSTYSLEEALKKIPAWLDRHETLRKDLIALMSNEDLQTHSSRSLEEYKTLPSRSVAFVGATGSGKSTVINALLEEISYNDKNDYRADVHFMTRTEWTKELNELKGDIGDDIQQQREKFKKMKYQREVTKVSDCVKKSWQKQLIAVYNTPEKSFTFSDYVESVHNSKSVDSLLDNTKCKWNRPFLTECIDVKKEIVCTKAKDLSSSLRLIIGDRGRWPLIKKVNVRVHSAVLSTGITLVDLPGFGDNNEARSAVAEEYRKSIDHYFVVMPVTRAVDSKFTQVTKCDDLNVAEIATNYDLDDNEHFTRLEEEHAQWREKLNIAMADEEDALKVVKGMMK
ncbi:hypothetical protein C0993_008477 [Termitomyces sp. T159_Od127]|nr:hypothetical protein C0993_008477 [Termitomyces sp. T159_Od127]